MYSVSLYSYLCVQLFSHGSGFQSQMEQGILAVYTGGLCEQSPFKNGDTTSWLYIKESSDVYEISRLCGRGSYVLRYFLLCFLNSVVDPSFLWV